MIFLKFILKLFPKSLGLERNLWVPQSFAAANTYNYVLNVYINLKLAS